MKKLLLLLFLLFTSCFVAACSHPVMKISSPVFEDQSAIPKRYTCQGENMNPPLQIENVPEAAKSLLLIVDDPDAPMGTWVHWTVWNIDPQTREISENSVPSGSVQGITSFQRVGYGGPCPPSGRHRYFFKLFALDMLLPEDENLQSADLLRLIEGHILEEAVLMGVYEKEY